MKFLIVKKIQMRGTKRTMNKVENQPKISAVFKKKAVNDSNDQPLAVSVTVESTEELKQ